MSGKPYSIKIGGEMENGAKSNKKEISITNKV
jgi:hypothetical protein